MISQRMLPLFDDRSSHFADTAVTNRSHGASLPLLQVSKKRAPRRPSCRLKRHSKLISTNLRPSALIHAVSARAGSASAGLANSNR